MREIHKHSDSRRQYLKLLGAGITVGLAGCQGDGGGSGSGDGDDGGDGGGGDGGGGDGGGGVREITSLGGITGGSGYQQCLAFQQVVQKEFDDVRVSVSGTSGWSTDAKLMWEHGRDETGIVPAGDAFDILHGNEPYNEEKNYIVQMYPAVPPTYLHVVVPADSDIESYSDLNGARLNVLSRGSLTEELMPPILQAIGVEVGEPLHYPHQEAASALQQGDADAVAAAGVAAPYIELSQQMPLRVLSLDEGQEDPINQEFPWLGFADYDFGQQYEGAGEAHVPAPWTVMACLLSLEDDLVYRLTEAVFNNIEMISSIYEPAADLAPELAPDTRVPVHPGAYEYYQEQGVEFPEELQPPSEDELPLDG